MKTNTKTKKHRLLAYGMIPESQMPFLIKNKVADYLGVFADDKGREYAAYHVYTIDKVEAYPVKGSRAFSKSMRRRTFFTKFKHIDRDAKRSVKAWNGEKDAIDKEWEVNLNK